MHTIGVTIVLACMVAFLACWLWAIVNWLLFRAAVKDDGTLGQVSVFAWSTSTPQSHPAYPYWRNFLRAIGYGTLVFVVGVVVGLGFGVLH